MRVRFWGTRGSIATPGPSTVRFGGNTSCVELTTASGELFVFDCGTGARMLGHALTPPTRARFLVSHSHWDHIQGFPFFTPLFVPANEFDVYAPRGSDRSLHEVLAGQMEFTYFPVELTQLPARITYHELTEGSHQLGGVQVFAHYLHHPAPTLGYRVETPEGVVVYLSDHEPYSESLWRGDAPEGRLESILHDGDRRHARFMTDADLVIHDAQYTPEEYRQRKTWGHSTYEYVVELAAVAGVRRVALTHHDPMRDDRAVEEIEKRARAIAEKRGAAMEVFCAFEGMTVDVASSGTRRPFTLDTAPLAPVTEGLHVLLVDDDPDVRRLAKRALTREGHSVTEAPNGRVALEMIAQTLPDFVVLDLDMPEVGGLDVLKSLRAREQTARLPVLILTARDDEQSTRAGFDVGTTDYLGKPFSMPQLAARVRACIARGAMR